MKTALLLTILALAAFAPWRTADARWVWIQDITPFYAPALLHGRAAWGERPAWCHHGRHWSCR